MFGGVLGGVEGTPWDMHSAELCFWGQIQAALLSFTAMAPPFPPPQEAMRLPAHPSPDLGTAGSSVPGPPQEEPWGQARGLSASREHADGSSLCVSVRV